MKDTHQLILVYVLAVIGVFTIIGIEQASSESDLQESTLEINENQEISVNDEVFRTIHVKLADGISSADELR